MVEFKTCTHPDCTNPSLPDTEDYFYKQLVRTKKKGTYYKLSTWCKECTKKNSRQWQLNHPEQFDEYHKDKYQKWEKDRKYYKRNEENRKKKQKEWQKRNPEKIKEYNDWTKMHKAHEILQEELDELYEYAESSCMYCGITELDHKDKYGQRLHRDHAINDGSNKIDNCILACKSCNTSKRDKDWYDWYTPKNEKYDEIKYIKILNWLSKFK